MNRFLLLSAFILLILGLFACSSGDSVESSPGATSAAPLEVVATQVAVNLTAAVPAPSATENSNQPEPAGLLVVYPKADGLWVWTGATEAVQLTSGADSRPRLSADRKLVAFQRGAELWVVEISGQNPHQLFAEAGATPLQFEFKPASQTVYFTTASADGTPRFDLNLSANGTLRNLLPAGQGGQFTFTPDGQALALVQPEKISTARADGSARQVVYQFRSVKSLKAAYLPQIAWLEDGSGFKTVIPGDAGQPARLIFVMAAGGPPAQLAQFPAAPPSVSETFIAPDGSKVLYVKELGGKLELHVIDASTADKAYFAAARDKFGLLGWTPDSKNMLFWLEDPRRAWITAGNTQSPLSDVAFAASLTWLDAETYLFLNESELRLRTNGQPSQLLDTGVTDGFAVLKIR